MQFFELAKEKDPKFALAYAGISDVWYGRHQLGYPPAEVSPRAIAAIMKAIELDSTRAEVQYSYGLINMNIIWDWKCSESSFKKAIALNPNYADAYASYSNFLIIVGRSKEALDQIEIALKLDPQNIMSQALNGITQLFARKYNNAITAFNKTLKIDSTNTFALGNLAITLHLTGRYEEAAKLWSSYFHNSFKNFVHVFDQDYIKAGYIEAMKLEADTLTVQSKTTYINPTEIAVLYACAGNKEQTLDMLEKAY